MKTLNSLSIGLLTIVTSLFAATGCVVAGYTTDPTAVVITAVATGMMSGLFAMIAFGE